VRRGREDGISGAAVCQPGSGALAAGRRKGTASGVFLDAPDGTETLLLPDVPGSASISNIAWSPDGTQLAYTLQTGRQHDIWILTPGGSPATEPLLDGPAAEHSPAFSPDGRWLAYVSEESGRREVYVQRYPRGERLPVSIDGGVTPV
jgi:Tol biopolymer transport system component